MNHKMSSQETPMFWKVEPLSPSGTPPPLYDDEEWLFLDEKPAVLVDDNGEESVLYEEQLTRAQVASKFLEELELKQWIKEESFADWLEEKIDIPIFEDLSAPECGQNRAVIPYPAKPQPIHVISAAPMVIGVNGGDTTQSLLREFETVLGDVEACHQIASTTTLTPPQSPPPILCKQQLSTQPQAHLLVSLQPIHHHHHHQQLQQAFIYEQQQHLHQYHEETAAITTLHGQPQPSNTDYALPMTNNNNANSESISHHQQQQQQQQQQQHIAEQWTAENLSLDPLVHSDDVAQELAKVDEYVRSCAEDVAPSPSCSSTSCTSEDSSDPDWSFESSSPSTSSSPRKITSTGRGGGGGGRRGSKPYSRPNVEDKRVRKKEQNKNAATRYRQKKKQEVKEIVGEEQELNNKNEQLQGKVQDLQREIGYLKGLMRDLFKAKGLIK